MSPPDQPKDRFFRRYLSIPRNAKKLLRWKLPAGLHKVVDWRTVNVRSSTFVDERLRRRESDLLIELRTKGGDPVLVFVLWEHQSTVDPQMAWRLLCYRVEIWKAWRVDHPNAQQFPFIHAMVLHQGKSTWSAKLDFGEMIGFDALGQPQAPVGQAVVSEYEVVSVTDLAELGWPGDLNLRVGLSLMHAVTQGTQTQWLVDRNSDLKDLLKQPGGGVSFQVVVEYILVTEDDRDKVHQALKQTEPIIETTAMSIAEQLHKEGVEEGIEQLVLTMLANDAKVDEIAKLTGLSVSQVNKIRKKQN